MSHKKIIPLFAFLAGALLLAAVSVWATDIGNTVSATAGVNVATTSPARPLSINGKAFLDSSEIRFASSSASSLTMKYAAAATSTVPQVTNAWSIATTTNAAQRAILSVDALNGRVGIRVSNAATPLDVRGNPGSFRISSIGQEADFIRSNSSLKFTGFNLGYLQFQGTVDNYATVQAGAIVNSRTEGCGCGELWNTSSSASLNFETTPYHHTIPVPRMWITASGLVGIGNWDDINSGLIPTNQLDISIVPEATAKTSAFSTLNISNTATSTTASIIKSGMKISSTGAWSGSGASNIGLYVSSVTGGTNNYDAIFNGGGNVGIGTTSPGALLSVDPSSTSATGTIQIGNKQSTTNGSCIQMYTSSGVAYRVFVAKSGTLTASQGACTSSH